MKSVIPKHSQQTKDDCLQLYIVGFESHEIEARTGVNGNTLRGWVMKGAWNERRRKQKELYAEKNPIEERPMMKAFASKKEDFKAEYIAKSGENAVENIRHIKKIGAEARLEIAQNIAVLTKVDRDNLGLNKDDEQGEKSLINLTFLTNANQPGFVIELEPEKVKQIEHHAEPTAE